MVSALLRRGVSIIIERTCAVFVPTLVGVAFMLLLSFAQSPQLSAQNETGVRSVNPQNWGLHYIWYSPATQRFQTAYPILRTTPPLSSDMPFDILLRYILLDSLLRTLPESQSNAMISRWTSMNDTLAGALESIYTLSDYNPIIYNQYALETFLHQRPILPRDTSSRVKMGYDGKAVPYAPSGTLPKFVNRLHSLRNNLCYKYRRIAPDSAERNAIFSLLYSDYILRVKVVAIDSMKDAYTSNKYPEQIYRVIAQVQDTLRGKVYQPFHYEWLHPKEGNKSQDETYPLIAFEYKGKRRIYAEHGDDSWYNTPDTALLNGNGDVAFRIGQEAVVFFGLANALIDSTHDYFDVELDPRCSLRALAIDNGMVRDINHVWTNNTLIAYTDWKSRVQQLINKIKSRQY